MSEQIRVSESPNQNKRCSVCHSDIVDEPEVTCPGCETKLHVDCFHDLKQCPTIGCGVTFPSSSSNTTEQTVGEPVEATSNEVAEMGEFALAWRGLKRLFGSGSYLRWMLVWAFIGALTSGLIHYAKDPYRFKRHFVSKSLTVILLGFFVFGPIAGAGLRYLMLLLVEYGKGKDDPKASS